MITTKLRRIKTMRWISQIIIWIIGSPFALIYFLGKFSEYVFSFLVNGYDIFERFIVKRFNWNEVAKKQYKENPNKFK